MEIKMKIGLSPKKSFDTTLKTTYQILDVVTNKNYIYISLQNNNLGHALTETDWWECAFDPSAAVDATTAANTAAAAANNAATTLDGNTEILAQIDATLNGERKSSNDVINSGELGDIHVTSISNDTMYQICGQPLKIIYAGVPYQVPDFAGQEWIDTTNKKAYIAFGTSTLSDWILMN